MKDEINFPFEGRVTVKQVDVAGNLISEQKFNLVVSQARTVLRDLLFSADVNDTITKIQLGDLGLTLNSNLTNLPAPTVGQTTLINPFFSKTANSRSTSIIDGRAAISLNFVILANEANDPNPTVNTKLIAELGLQTQGNRLFAVLNKAIIKTRESGLDITWDILI